MGARTSPEGPATANLSRREASEDTPAPTDVMSSTTPQSHLSSTAAFFGRPGPRDTWLVGGAPSDPADLSLGGRPRRPTVVCPSLRGSSEDRVLVPSSSSPVSSKHRPCSASFDSAAFRGRPGPRLAAGRSDESAVRLPRAAPAPPGRPRGLDSPEETLGPQLSGLLASRIVFATAFRKSWAFISWLSWLSPSSSFPIPCASRHECAVRLGPIPAPPRAFLLPRPRPRLVTRSSNSTSCSLALSCLPITISLSRVDPGGLPRGLCIPRPRCCHPVPRDCHRSLRPP